MSTAQAVLGNWPFGGVDAPQLHRSDRPTPRFEEHSVPSVGPNPFLAAARMQHARDAVDALR